MHKGLTYFLLKTVSPKPKGLKLKVEIVRCTEHLITFDESSHPAATIMSHGLFLAAPESCNLRFPMVLGIINHEELNDDRLDSKFGVIMDAQVLEDHETTRMEKSGSKKDLFLGKRNISGTGTNSSEKPNFTIQSEISLFRHGMVKNVQNSSLVNKMLVRHLQPDRSGESDRFYFSSRTPDLHLLQAAGFNTLSLTPRDLFVGIMQFILQSSIQVYGPVIRAPFKSLQNLFESLHTSLVHFSQFQEPWISTDLNDLESMIKNRVKELADLCSAMLELLIEPLCGFPVPPKSTMEEGVSDQIGSSPSFGDFFLEDAHMAKSITEMLIEHCQKDPIELRSRDGKIGGLLQPRFHGAGSLPTHGLLKLLQVPEVQRYYFEKLGGLLATYPPVSASLQQTIESLMEGEKTNPEKLKWLVENAITNRYSRISDEFLRIMFAPHLRFCMSRSIGSHESVYFCPSNHDVDDLRLIALVAHANTKICIMIEKIPGGNGNLGTDPVVKVIRDETEIASFKLSPNPIIGRAHCRDYVYHYFTGRYFIKLNKSRTHARYSEFWILDLAPCMLGRPSSPSESFESIHYFQGFTSCYQRVCFGWSDRFISYLFFDLAAVRDKTTQANYIQSAMLRIIPYDRLSRSMMKNPIDLAPQFRSLVKELGEAIVLDYSIIEGQHLCWSQDLTKLFFANLSSLDMPRKSITFMIACFEVTQSLDSIKLMTYQLVDLRAIIECSKITRKWRLQTLRTKLREYLILDMMAEFRMEYEIESLKPAVLARLIFTIHKKKLQLVPVNRKSVFWIPPTIGQQMEYAGYHSSQLSLWHHRRVFSADKIVSAVYRIAYIPR